MDIPPLLANDIGHGFFGFFALFRREFRVQDKDGLVVVHNHLLMDIKPRNVSGARGYGHCADKSYTL
jgi:hypothetical protein